MNQRINFISSVGSEENFRKMLYRNPIIIHFSGHGVQNNQNYLKNEYSLHKSDGDILILEDSAGLAVNFFEK